MGLFHARAVARLLREHVGALRAADFRAKKFEELQIALAGVASRRGKIAARPLGYRRHLWKATPTTARTNSATDAGSGTAALAEPSPEPNCCCQTRKSSPSTTPSSLASPSACAPGPPNPDCQIRKSSPSTISFKSKSALGKSGPIAAVRTSTPSKMAKRSPDEPSGASPSREWSGIVNVAVLPSTE